jgi:hypothetical protein
MIRQHAFGFAAGIVAGMLLSGLVLAAKPAPPRYRIVYEDAKGHGLTVTEERTGDVSRIDRDDGSPLVSFETTRGEDLSIPARQIVALERVRGD